jgi:hypothetical protein
VAIFPWGWATGNWDIEYLFRMTRLTKISKALNMLDGRGLSFLISRLFSQGSRDESIGINFAMQFWGGLT